MAMPTPTPTSMPTRAIQAIADRYRTDLDCLASGAPSQQTLHDAVKALQNKGYSHIGEQLRVLRNITLHRLFVLDCEQAAPLSVIMQGMTDLAQVCLQLAAQTAHTQLARQYGEPMAQGERSQLWIVGMGKLGARELNVSSDIDLIYVYQKEGYTHPTSPEQTSIANHDFFAAQVRLIQSLLADVTEHGFVFRVDLALRPYGKEGALAVSLSRLAQYFQRSGREWERFAWLKSRVIPIQYAAGEKPIDVLPLRSVVRAFVFRSFLDFNVFTALQGLHQLIRQHADSSLGERDIKLGSGGIREIEFAAQVMQIVRGGRHPELLARPTLAALERLQQAELMAPELAAALASAYVFLRRLEHRIQYLDDAQTHALPTSPEDMAWIAHSMGFASIPLFQAQLQHHREQVQTIFTQWLQRGITPQVPTITVENLKQKAAWTINYLRKHPDAVDELNQVDKLGPRFQRSAFHTRLRLQYQALQATQLCDEEGLLDLLRRAYHAEVFRTLVRDVQGQLSVRDVGDDLSNLADCVLELVLQWCWDYLSPAARESWLSADVLNRFAVIAYGKLGGKELGYGSDLDLVFIYDDDSESAPMRYGALVRKLIAWITAKTSEGDLYEIDTALRPNGNSGLLVTSMRSYEHYQMQRGSNTAWTWELQAITRARCAVGSVLLRQRFDRLRAQVLATPRDAGQLQTEISMMRQRLYAAHPTKADQFDIKHSPGGMLDTEFAVQYLVLAHAKDYPALIDNLGNIELLRIAQAHRLVPVDIALKAADAYQVLRDQQHAARLQEKPAVVSDQTLLDQRAAVQALWNHVFRTSAPPHDAR